MDAKETAKKIVATLKEELKLYALIDQRLDEQERAIRNEDERLVFKIIDEKDEALQTLREQDRQLAQWTQQFSPAQLDFLEEKTRALRDKLSATLKSILAKEETCDKLLQSLQSRTGSKMTGVKKGKIGLKGYSLPSRVKPKISKNI
ncbi:MAG: flagellar protein FlgN [Candidatus Nitrohelix vancouverensis]|uniref:Flagellar protein FlgN n=1 Tax=Candidatus Nitrohelix vancouverensis TaxID=2705534 RepID=A0A7T0C119_9BACT|nr:MAG: flagellar protein FlgN [Candidatus Nitrohelix vancouverensis]